MRTFLAQLSRDPSRLLNGGDSDDRKRPPMRYVPDLRYVSPRYEQKFQQLEQDAETSAWLAAQMNPSRAAAWLSDLLHACCFSRTTANGICQRGGMFVFSTEQFCALTERAPGAGGGGRLLDIGAGDGGVTERAAKLFDTVDVTEVSQSMQWLLKRRGFTVVDDAFLQSREAQKRYDVVTCLNVLDRCDTPWTLLRNIRTLVKDDGLVVLAVVLPWCPFVEVQNKQKAPSEQLPMSGGLCREGARFERAASIMMENVLEVAGFEVVKWSRVPYLSEGSATHQYYALDDALFVLKPR